MKKLLLFFTILSILSACGRQHIYHTYYGIIDTDTMEALISPEGFKYYAVHTTVLDSAQAAVMGADSMWLTDYYIPSQNKYFTTAHSSNGNSSPKVYFNPINETVDSIR